MPDLTAETPCAVCGFPLRLFPETMRGTDTLVYLHPYGAGDHAPHRGVVGTRAEVVLARPVEVEEEPVVEPHPEPQVRAREPEPGELSAGPKGLLALAQRLGLPSRARYARGVPFTSTGEPAHLVRLEPKMNNAGERVMTDGRKPANVEVKLDEHKVVESLAVWVGDPVVAVAVWEGAGPDVEKKRWSSLGAWLLEPYLQDVGIKRVKEVLGERADG